jgi:hypothetical protein
MGLQSSFDFSMFLPHACGNLYTTLMQPNARAYAKKPQQYTPSFSCNLRLEAIAKYRFTFCDQILTYYAKLYNRAERFESKKVESR